MSDAERVAREMAREIVDELDRRWRIKSVLSASLIDDMWDRLAAALQARDEEVKRLSAALIDVLHVWEHLYPLDDLAWKRALTNAHTAIRKTREQS